MVAVPTWRRRVIGILLSVSAVGVFHLIRGTTNPRATILIAGACVVVFVLFEYMMWRADLPRRS